MPRRSALERDLIRRAQARLDRLHLYPAPVRTRRVRILHTPWLFRSRASAAFTATKPAR